MENNEKWHFSPSSVNSQPLQNTYCDRSYIAEGIATHGPQHFTDLVDKNCQESTVVYVRKNAHSCCKSTINQYSQMVGNRYVHDNILNFPRRKGGIKTPQNTSKLLGNLP